MVAVKRILPKEYKLLAHSSDTELKKKWVTIKNLFTKNKNSIITAVNSFREKKNMGVNEFCKNIDISSRQFYRLLDYSENITLMTIAELAEFMEYDLEISFKKKNK